mgnify:CR=1 FL=1
MESLLDITTPLCYDTDMESKLSISKEGSFEKPFGGDPQRTRHQTRGFGRGVSRQTIGSLENGRYNPSILLAFKIARYFDMTIEEIFIYEEDAK